jgi:hypothetical protein
MRHKPAKRKLREVVITFCEGETEIMLFAFFKIVFSNKKIEFRPPINLGGVNNLRDFKRTYNKQMRAQSLKPKKEYTSVKFLFFIDNDLPDSDKILSFLKTRGHLVQLSEPNSEGLILSMVGKNQGQNLKTEDFRKKCKKNFKDHFNCEVHQLKEGKLKQIFNTISILKTWFPVLHNLFTKD